MRKNGKPYRRIKLFRSIFLLFKGKKLKIRLTRDSVSAGDDIDAPHEKIVSIPSLTDPQLFMRQISSRYLPKIAGYGHSWDCILNNELIGIWTISGIESKVDQINFATMNHCHFKYHSATY